MTRIIICNLFFNVSELFNYIPMTKPTQALIGTDPGRNTVQSVVQIKPLDSGLLWIDNQFIVLTPNAYKHDYKTK